MDKKLRMFRNVLIVLNFTVSIANMAVCILNIVTGSYVLSFIEFLSAIVFCAWAIFLLRN